MKVIDCGEPSLQVVLTVLLAIPLVLPTASEPFDIVQILLEQTSTLWRDFVVAGLSTATKAALQIWYRT